MRNRVLYIFLLLCSFGILNAQEVFISPPSKLPSKMDNFELLGNNDNGIYVHYYGSSQDEIELFNYQLRPVIRKEINVKEKNAQIESIYLRERGAIAFYSVHENGNQYLKAKWISDYLDVSSKFEVLDSIVNIKTSGYTPFYIKQSPNFKYYAFFSIFEDKSSLLVKYKILDSELQFIDGGDFEVKDRNIVLKSFKVNDNGVVYAVMAHQEKNNDANDYIYDEIYTFVYDPISQKGLQQHNSKQEGLFFKNIVTEIDPITNRAYSAACYKSISQNDDIGFIVMSTSPDSEKSLQHKYPITKEFTSVLHSYEAKDWRDQAKIILPKKIIPQSDGGCLIISEGQYRYTKVVRNSPYSSYPYGMYGDMYTRVYDQNHYFDITTLSINGNGKVNWTSVMPKMQITEGDEGLYSSFETFESNNLLKFLFNEDVYSNGNFVEYNLNPAGETKRMSILNTQKDGLLLIPQKGIQVSSTDLVIPSEQKRNLQLVLFKY